MFDFNKVFLSGRAGNPGGPNSDLINPPIKDLGQTKVCEVGMCIDLWNSKEQKSNPMWWNVVFWNKLAEIASERLVKGTPFAIEGALRDGSYKNRDGIYIYKPVIWANVLYGPRKGETYTGGGGSRNYGGEPSGGYSGGGGGAAAPAYEDFDVGDLGPPLDMDDPASQ